MVEDINTALYMKIMTQVHKSMQKDHNISFAFGHKKNEIETVIVYHDNEDDDGIAAHYFRYNWETALFNALALLYHSLMVGGDEAEDIIRDTLKKYPRLGIDFIKEAIEYTDAIKKEITEEISDHG